MNVFQELAVKATPPPQRAQRGRHSPCVVVD